MCQDLRRIAPWLAKCTKMLSSHRCPVNVYQTSCAALHVSSRCSPAIANSTMHAMLATAVNHRKKDKQTHNDTPNVTTETCIAHKVVSSSCHLPVHEKATSLLIVVANTAQTLRKWRLGNAGCMSHYAIRRPKNLPKIRNHALAAAFAHFGPIVRCQHTIVRV